METKEALLEHLEQNSDVLQNPAIKAAFTAVDRADFVMEDYIIEAYEDYPLPIGYDQTISQPTTVAFMLELLDAQEGDAILDVGSGSGWTTALLADMVGESGRVLGVERISELVAFGKANLAKYAYDNASIMQTENEDNFLSEGPFNRILVSAALPEEVPQQFIDQLTDGGVIVASVDDAIIRVLKRHDGNLEHESYPGFAFVPYIAGSAD